MLFVVVVVAAVDIIVLPKISVLQPVWLSLKADDTDGNDNDIDNEDVQHIMIKLDILSCQ